MEKIKFEKLNEAVIATTNSVDTERVYDIEASVKVVGTDVTTIDNGIVKENNTVVCAFSTWSKGSLNTNFQGALNISKMCAVLAAIDAFINEVETEVSSGEAIILK